MGCGTWYLLNSYLSGTTNSNDSRARITGVPAPEEWQIISVHDGDTIKAKKSVITESFRLCGIDAPEISQPLGKESRDYLRTLLGVSTTSFISSNNQVQISITGTDRYNRKIAEIFLGEKFINGEMVQTGMAYHYAQYSSNCPNRISLKNGEAIARTQKLGIWSGDYQKPWEYRRSKRK